MDETSSDRFPEHLLSGDRSDTEGQFVPRGIYSPPDSLRPSLHRIQAEAPHRPATQWQPQHWRLRTKLIALAVVPMVLAAVLGVLRILDSARHSQNAAVRDAVIIGVILLLCVLLLVVLAASVLRPLRILRTAAFDVADRQLPAVIEQLRSTEGRDANIRVDPVPVYSREDVGQVARAFDAVHSEAVRLAGEQAALRANVNDMFVNLSRRSQSLVERQLRLIDELELGEQDSDRLSSLFRLDHLATRMRRNGENLLVLAGADLRQRSGEPVPVLDVLRAAVSEIEDYRRVAMRPLPRALVSGLAVNDIVHLVAELLDNATAYSDPQSQVTLTAQFADEGGLAVEIRDEGTGIPPARLGEINRRLAAPPAVDVSVSRQMGLFVVARLATRHGITVALVSPADPAGIAVTVVIPKLLITAESAHLAQRDDYLGRSLTNRPPIPGPVNRETDRDIFRPAATTFLDAEPPQAPSPGVIPAQRRLLDSSDEFPAVNGAALDTPIFQSVLSKWFTDHQEPQAGAEPAGAEPAGAEPAGAEPAGAEPAGAVPAGATEAGAEEVDAEVTGTAPAEGEEPAAASDPAVPAAVAMEGPGDIDASFPVPVEEPRRPAGGWESVADAGWQAAEAASEPTVEEYTAVGLPKRRPQAFLVPGAAGGSWMSEDQPVASATRNAEAVRGRMSSYQRGLKLGRHAQNGQSTDQVGAGGDTRGEQPTEGNQ